MFSFDMVDKLFGNWEKPSRAFFETEGQYLFHSFLDRECPYNDDSLLSDSIIFGEECVLNDMETNPIPSNIQTQGAQQAEDVNSISLLKCIADSQSPVHAT